MIKKILAVSTLLSILILATTTTLLLNNVNAYEEETTISEVTAAPQNNATPEIAPQDNIIPEVATPQDTICDGSCDDYSIETKTPQNKINVSKKDENIIVTRNGKNIIVSQNNDNKTTPKILAEEILDNGDKITVLETTEGKIDVVVESKNQDGEREIHTYNADDLVDADF